MESKWFFMHFMAWYFPSLTFWALRTSLKVPSPFFATSLYLRSYKLRRKRSWNKLILSHPWPFTHRVRYSGSEIQSELAVPYLRYVPTVPYGTMGKSRKSHANYTQITRKSRRSLRWALSHVKNSVTVSKPWLHPSFSLSRNGPGETRI